MKIALISCTKGNLDPTLPIAQSIVNLNIPFIKDIHIDNKEGISTRYNESIERHKDDVDYLLFCHDDVYINDCFLIDKITKYSKQFDVMGAAGSSYFNINSDPLSWHNCPRENWAGSVMHPLQDKTANSAFIQTTFGPAPKAAIAIDGLFIVCKASIFQKPQIRFDSQFKFDFYDLDFSLNCYMNKIKIGVIPIMITHLSRGAGLHAPGYKETQIKFFNKWKNKKA